MKPGFHLALARWKSRFTWFTAGQTRPRGSLTQVCETSPACGLASLNLWRTPNMAAFAQVKAKREDVTQLTGQSRSCDWPFLIFRQQQTAATVM